MSCTSISSLGATESVAEKCVVNTLSARSTNRFVNYWMSGLGDYVQTDTY